MYTAPNSNNCSCFLANYDKYRDTNQEFLVDEPPTKNRRLHKDKDLVVSYMETLSQSQRLLLKWNHRLCHRSMKNLQKLSKQGLLPKEIANCDIPVCSSCEYGKAKKQPVMKNVCIHNHDPDCPGDQVHMDQAISSSPGHQLMFSGKSTKKMVNTFTLFVDEVSKKTFFEFHHGALADVSIKTKQNVERDAFVEGLTFKRLRAYNGIYKSKAFENHVLESKQSLSFCEVGAHHQNGMAERSIRTVFELAWTALLHAHSKCPDIITFELCPFAVRHDVDTWNDTSREGLLWNTLNGRLAGVHLTPDDQKIRLKTIILLDVRFTYLPNNYKMVRAVTNGTIEPNREYTWASHVNTHPMSCWCLI